MFKSIVRSLAMLGALVLIGMVIAVVVVIGSKGNVPSKTILEANYEQALMEDVPKRRQRDCCCTRSKRCAMWWMRLTAAPLTIASLASSQRSVRLPWEWRRRRRIRDAVLDFGHARNLRWRTPKLSANLVRAMALIIWRRPLIIFICSPRAMSGCHHHGIAIHKDAVQAGRNLSRRSSL